MIQFVWTFTNTIDGLSGTAIVMLTKELRGGSTIASYNIQGNNGVLCKFTCIELGNH